MKTIIKINFTNYSENNTVLNLNCLVALVEKMKKDADFVSYEIVQAGEDVEQVKAILFPTEQPTEKLVKDVKINYCGKKAHKTFTIDVVVRQDGKVKIIADTFGGDYVNKFQTVKQTSLGEYIKLYGRRVYFTFEAPAF